MSEAAPADSLIDPTQLGGLDRPDLAVALRPLWEDAGPLADGLVGVAVSSWSEHLAAAEACIAAMDEPTRVRLLRAHPRIGAPPEQLAGRSRTSLAEQGGAAEDPQVLAELDALNDDYERRFGFPLVEWVRGRSRRDMIPVLRARLARERGEELEAGCRALAAIARDRLGRLDGTARTRE